MPKVVLFHETGPADVLRIENLPQQQPRENEVRLRVEAIGLNRDWMLNHFSGSLQSP
jgi:NADPH:quinone reductase-like Zn-dependent oxidoreductase